MPSIIRIVIMHWSIGDGVQLIESNRATFYRSLPVGDGGLGAYVLGC